MNAPFKILVIEDDPHIRLGLQELLVSEGYAVELCPRGDLAVESVQRAAPHLLLLDVMLPGCSGFDLCRTLRQHGHRVPILMLTAKGAEIDKVIGLELGADDYVTKPFGTRELLARIQALLRRAHATPATATPGTSPRPSPTDDFVIGSSRINPRAFHLQRDGDTFDLTARELAVLQLFARHPGEVLSRERLLAEVWGQKYMGTTRTLDQVIVQVRRKLGDPAESPQLLLTVHGVGYRLAAHALRPLPLTADPGSSAKAPGSSA